MGKNDLVTIQEFAKLAGVSRQAVYKQLTNRLHSYCQLVDNQKMLERRALIEVFGCQPCQLCQPEDDKVDSQLNDTDEILFLRKQVEHLQLELEKERAHNREKDKQLLETLSKLADSQAALAAGQAAQKQKELADKLIEGKNILSGEGKQQDAAEGQSWFQRLFRR